MLSKETYNTIRERLKSGVYRSICLVRKTASGDDEIIWSHNRIRDAEKPLAKLDYFKLKLNRELPAGDYEIQAKASISHNAVDKFPVHVPEKKPLTEPENKNGLDVHHDKYEQLEDSEFMDIDEYKTLLRENADLKGQLTMMTIERNWFKQMAEGKEAKKDQELADKSSAGAVLADLAKETVPGVINLVQEFISMRKEEAKTKASERNGKVKLNKTSSKPGAVNLNKVVIYYFNLLNTDEDRANNELDLLEEQNPALYAQVYERLWPEQEEEEQEEEEEELEEEEQEEETEEEQE